ncbi:MAG TPA: nucleotidyl transferase AbiEii/AbiGii toxin family protein, partial [Afipia sp.]|nr:nucleotidyl transferase AbiEii/AbiGii toxin family protein [Afipia sp.]
MDKVALMPAADRAALFNQAGAARGLADAIIEKDFWVCWT